MLFNGVFPFLSLFPAQRFGTLKRLVFITKERKKKRRFDDWILEPVGAIGNAALLEKIEIITLHLKRYLEKKKQL